LLQRAGRQQTRAFIGVIAVAVFGVAGCGLNPGAPRPSDAATAIPSTGSVPGRVIAVTGHGLLELSETQFRFAADSGTYTVVMDVQTRCVNLRGKLLGGYQIVARILMVTSLPITITGTVDGATLHATTVLIPADKDALT
jgi:hypothetical protein